MQREVTAGSVLALQKEPSWSLGPTTCNPCDLQQVLYILQSVSLSKKAGEVDRRHRTDVKFQYTTGRNSSSVLLTYWLLSKCHLPFTSQPGSLPHTAHPLFFLSVLLAPPSAHVCMFPQFSPPFL